MRCPRCNQEINPHSERCPNCGTSARYAVPEGDTLSRIRRHNSIIQGENEVSGDELSDASFSPVLKFDKPVTSRPEELIDDNPADNFDDESFDPVDISAMIDSPDSDEQARHRQLSSDIQRMISNKQDDLLAEYYFKDGISDLERYQLEQSYARLDSDTPEAGSGADNPSGQDNGGSGEEMSEAAKRLSSFPEETGVDKILTHWWEKYDAAVLWLKSFFRRQVADRFVRVYDRFDNVTSGFMNGVLDRTYYSKFGAMKRKKADGDKEEMYHLRCRVWGIVAAVLVLVISAFVLLHILRSDDINGEWIISTDTAGNPNIVMEFKPGGSAIISVKSEDGWHVHKKGTYKTRRQNGRNMLVIQYDDGDVKRLYYVIEGDTGTFNNVDTNTKNVYKLK